MYHFAICEDERDCLSYLAVQIIEAFKGGRVGVTAREIQRKLKQKNIDKVTIVEERSGKEA